MKNREEILKLDDADLVGQLLCYDIRAKDDPEEVEKILSKIRPGGIFLAGMTEEQIKLYTDMANKYTKLPVIVVADVELGPGENFPNWPVLTNAMAMGACDDDKLIEEAWEVAAKFCRLKGIHWTLAPVIDINVNHNNPVVNIRSASDSGKQVGKIMGAFIRGVQKNGYMSATLKHFPGDGVDDRNQHFCTTINSLSMDKWKATYGELYQDMINEDVAAVMAAHIALPAYANEKDEFGYVPATLSKPLMTDLLKGEMGFDGCIISDAMSMVGVAARVDLDKLAIEFIKNGGDMVLFNEPEDHELLLNALNKGELSRERVLDAVDRVITVKKKTRLFENQEDVINEIGESAESLACKINELGDKIAEKSIKFVRNNKGILPLDGSKKLKFLIIEFRNRPELDSTPITDELKKRGHEVDVYTDITHYEIRKVMDNYDCILINNLYLPAKHGASERAGWNDGVMFFWRGYILKHPKVIFTSFGDPYKLYDFPFLQTYINTFSYTEHSMRAFVKVLLGEKEMVAKNPISLQGEFERETI